MSSPRVTTVPLPPAKGRSIDGDSRRPTSRGMPREVGRRIKTGENSRPTIGENSTWWPQQALEHGNKGSTPIMLPLTWRIHSD